MRNTSSLLKDVIFATQISKTETKPEESQTTKKKWKEKTDGEFEKRRKKHTNKKPQRIRPKLAPARTLHLKSKHGTTSNSANLRDS